MHSRYLFFLSYFPWNILMIQKSSYSVGTKCFYILILMLEIIKALVLQVKQQIILFLCKTKFFLSTFKILIGIKVFFAVHVA